MIDRVVNGRRYLVAQDKWEGFSRALSGEAGGNPYKEKEALISKTKPRTSEARRVLRFRIIKTTD